MLSDFSSHFSFPRGHFWTVRRPPGEATIEHPVNDQWTECHWIAAWANHSLPNHLWEITQRKSWWIFLAIKTINDSPKIYCDVKMVMPKSCSRCSISNRLETAIGNVTRRFMVNLCRKPFEWPARCRRDSLWSHRTRCSSHAERQSWLAWKQLLRTKVLRNWIVAMENTCFHIKISPIARLENGQT